jgi:hypothetical protein
VRPPERGTLALESGGHGNGVLMDGLAGLTNVANKQGVRWRQINGCRRQHYGGGMERRLSATNTSPAHLTL